MGKAELLQRLGVASGLSMITLAALAASGYVATFVAGSSWFFRLFALLPGQIKTLAVASMQLLLQPIQPMDVPAQEEQLEFFLAWSFVVAIGGLALALGFAMRKLVPVSSENATSQETP